jgi:hypothetical protein
MYKKFSYSHTIRRDDEINRELKAKKQHQEGSDMEEGEAHNRSGEESEDELSGLFKIGNKHILNQ